MSVEQKSNKAWNTAQPLVGALDMLCGLSRFAGVAADMARHLMETDAPVRWARRTAAITAAAAAAHAVCDAEAALLVG